MVTYIGLAEFESEEGTQKAYEYYTGSKLPENFEEKELLQFKGSLDHEVDGRNQKLEIRYAVESVLISFLNIAGYFEEGSKRRI